VRLKTNSFSFIVLILHTVPINLNHYKDGGIAASSVAESFSTVTRGGERGIKVSLSLSLSPPSPLFRLFQNKTGTSIANAEFHSSLLSMSLISSSTPLSLDPGKKAPRTSAARTFSSSPWHRGQFCFE
jgi:hypothetical protein